MKSKELTDILNGISLGFIVKEDKNETVPMGEINGRYGKCRVCGSCENVKDYSPRDINGGGFRCNWFGVCDKCIGPLRLKHPELKYGNPE